MDKQAYLKMMNYGMHKQASQMQQQLLYKIATMNKEADIKQWWQKDGNKTRQLWQAFLRWLKSLFGFGGKSKKELRLADNKTQLQQVTSAWLKQKDPAKKKLYQQYRHQLLIQKQHIDPSFKYTQKLDEDMDKINLNKARNALDLVNADNQTSRILIMMTRKSLFQKEKKLLYDREQGKKIMDNMKKELTQIPYIPGVTSSMEDMKAKMQDFINTRNYYRQIQNNRVDAASDKYNKVQRALNNDTDKILQASNPVDRSRHFVSRRENLNAKNALGQQATVDLAILKQKADREQTGIKEQLKFQQSPTKREILKARLRDIQNQRSKAINSSYKYLQNSLNNP